MWKISLSSRYFWQAILDRLFPGRRPRRRRAQPYDRLHLEALEDRLVPATFNVPQDTSLLSAISRAAGSSDASSTILVAPGTYPVLNQLLNATNSLSIVGTSSGVIFTASKQGRVFEINQNVRLENLTITGGKVLGKAGAPAAVGGGLLIDGGQVTLSNVAVQSNIVQGATGTGNRPGISAGQRGQAAYGGGIYMSGGTLTLTGSTLISGNQVQGGKGAAGATVTANGAPFTGTAGPGGFAGGGGLALVQPNLNGTPVIVGENVTLQDNVAVAGDGGGGGLCDPSNFPIDGPAGGAALGGGLYIDTNPLNNVELFGADVAGNRASGGQAGNQHDAHGNAAVGGPALGGGCFVANGSLTLVEATFKNDIAKGAAGPDGVFNRTHGTYPGLATGGGPWAGVGGSGGAALGGGIYQDNGQVILYGGAITNCTASGGAGGNGVNNVPTIAYHVALTANHPNYPQAPLGGAGGAGGGGAGGGAYVGQGSLLLIQTAMSNDNALGGPGGNGGHGATALHRSNFNGLYNNAGGPGGRGGPGGNATGGGCFVAGTGTSVWDGQTTDANGIDHFTIPGSGQLTLVAASLNAEAARGGPGGIGGSGGQGARGKDHEGFGYSHPHPNHGLSPSTAIHTSSRYGGNGGNGGNATGGSGGNAQGGAVYGGGGIFLYGGSISGLAVGGKGGKALTAGNGGDGGAVAGPSPYSIIHGFSPSGQAITSSQLVAAGYGGNAGGSFGGNGGNADGGGVYLASDALVLTLDNVALQGTLEPGPGGAPGNSGAAGSPAAVSSSGKLPSFGQPGGAIPGTAGTAAGAGLQNDSSLTAATSGPQPFFFNLSPMPPSVNAGSPFPYPVYVVAEDAHGNVAGDYTGSVGLEVARGPGSLAGTLTEQAANGVAVFDNLSIIQPGTGYALQAAPGGLPTSSTNNFAVVGNGASHTWTGLGNNPNWNNPNNWLEGTKPGPNETLIFPANAARFTTLDDIPNLPVDEIDIGASYQFLDANGDALDLEADITVTGGDTTFAIPTVLEQPPAAAAANGAAAAPADAANAGDTIYVAATDGGIDYRGKITGNRGLIKTGPGILNLASPSDYTGTTQLKEGTLQIMNPLSLSTGDLQVNPAAGITVTLDCVVPLSLSNNVTLQGLGTLVVNGDLTLSGMENGPPSTLATGTAASNFVTLTGSLTLNDTLTGAATTPLVVGGTGTLTLGEKFNGSSPLTLTGGTLDASANAIPFSGNINVKAGTIRLGADKALGPGHLTLGSINTKNLVTVILQKNITLSSTDVHLGGGTVIVKGAGKTLTLPLVYLDDSTELDATANTVTFNKGYTGDIYTLVVGGTGTVQLGGQFFTDKTTDGIGTLDVKSGTVELLPSLEGSGEIDVDGATVDGAKLLSNSPNTVRGQIDVNSGTLQVGASQALGATGTILHLGSSLNHIGVKVNNTSGVVDLGQLFTYFDGGTVMVSGGKLTLSAFVEDNTEIDIAKGTTVALPRGIFDLLTKQGNLISSPLTVSGSGVLQLGGSPVGHDTTKPNNLNSQVTVNAGATVELLQGIFTNPDGSTVGVSLSGNGSIVVAGGTLKSLGSQLKFVGSITLNAGQINVENGADLGAGTTTVNAGQLNVKKGADLGTGTTTVNAGQLNVENGAALSGTTGTITVNGGTLETKGKVPQFTGSITLNGGQITVDKGADLGTGTITVPAGKTAAIVVQMAAILNNALTLNGGTLTLKGNLGLAGQVTLNGGTLETYNIIQIINQAFQLTSNSAINLVNGQVQFLKGVSGQYQLTVSGGPGILGFRGDLNGTTVDVKTGITVKKGNDFHETPPGHIVEE